MSILKKLFGIGTTKSGPGAAVEGAPVEYRGFTIRPAPYLEGGQYQTAGTITKAIGGIVKEHRFIRADRYPSLDVATEFSLTKARQIIDEQGERIFD
ncbi:MAG TPA: HlyU family transcriptional regulator [Xanthobacteraceae bacterium]|nr:HlyU family transcriptional regulator [Xanthobacteraceae bacterium]